MDGAVTFSLSESPEDEVEVRRPGLRDRGQRSSQQPEDLPAPGGADAQAETQAVARQTRPDLAPNLTTLDYTNTALHCTILTSIGRAGHLISIFLPVLLSRIKLKNVIDLR